MSKTEEIKASVAWIFPRNHAMTRSFRCAFSVALAPRGMMPGLISSVLDTLARSTRRANTRAEPPPKRSGLPPRQSGAGTTSEAASEAKTGRECRWGSPRSVVGLSPERDGPRYVRVYSRALGAAPEDEADRDRALEGA